MNITFCFIEAGTPAYEEMIDLRMEVLLKPIGVTRSYINPQKEAGDLLIGVYRDKVLVGCCILTPRNKNTTQLRQMAVATSCQGKGIGKEILAFAEKSAVEKGFSLLIMHARDTVLPFYQKCGYVAKGEPFIEVGIGHHLMQKILAPTEV